MMAMLTSLENAIDHLLLGVADLAEGIRWVESLTGVSAAPGGRHPGVGTHNALISLGGTRYLEIIAPDPSQEVYRFGNDVRGFHTPRLVTWAARQANLSRLAGQLRAAGINATAPLAGGRARPDGAQLRWQTLRVPSPFAQAHIDPIPFLIEWANDSRHPAQDSPSGCTLQSFVLAHPDPAGVSTLLHQLEIAATVEFATTATLRAVLRTPKGKVTLS